MSFQENKNSTRNLGLRVLPQVWGVFRTLIKLGIMATWCNPPSAQGSTMDPYRLFSARLELVLLSSDFLSAMKAGDRHRAAWIGGFTIPDDLMLSQSLLAMRLDQLRSTSVEQHPWLLRAIVLRESQTMCGHINFHSCPGPDELRQIAADGVELGYSVGANFRRRGYASEAGLTLMKWAFEYHHQRCFILSIRPDNIASLAMAQSLGFSEVGAHIDEEDGLELYYKRRISRWPEQWRS